MVKTTTQLFITNHRGKDDNTRKITLSNANYLGKDDNSRKIKLSNTNDRGKDDNTKKIKLSNTIIVVKTTI